MGGQLAASGGGCSAEQPTQDGHSEADIGLNSASRATPPPAKIGGYQAEGISLETAPPHHPGHACKTSGNLAVFNCQQSEALFPSRIVLEKHQNLEIE